MNMFSNLFIGVIAGIGFGGWVYGKLQRSTGGNTSSSLTGATLTALLAAAVVVTVLSILF